MSNRLKPVRAWGVVNSDGEIMAISGGFFQVRSKPSVREDQRSFPVVIVPLAEYRAMRAAQVECGKLFTDNQILRAQLETQKNFAVAVSKAKGKVKRGK